MSAPIKKTSRIRSFYVYLSLIVMSLPAARNAHAIRFTEVACASVAISLCVLEQCFAANVRCEDHGGMWRFKVETDDGRLLSQDVTHLVKMRVYDQNEELLPWAKELDPQAASMVKYLEGISVPQYQIRPVNDLRDFPPGTPRDVRNRLEDQLENSVKNALVQDLDELWGGLRDPSLVIVTPFGFVRGAQVKSEGRWGVEVNLEQIPEILRGWLLLNQPPGSEGVFGLSGPVQVFNPEGVRNRHAFSMHLHQIETATGIDFVRNARGDFVQAEVPCNRSASNAPVSNTPTSRVPTTLRPSLPPTKKTGRPTFFPTRPPTKITRSPSFRPSRKPTTGAPSHPPTHANADNLDFGTHTTESGAKIFCGFDPYVNITAEQGIVVDPAFPKEEGHYLFKENGPLHIYDVDYRDFQGIIEGAADAPVSLQDGCFYELALQIPSTLGDQNIYPSASECKVRGFFEYWFNGNEYVLAEYPSRYIDCNGTEPPIPVGVSVYSKQLNGRLGSLGRYRGDGMSMEVFMQRFASFIDFLRKQGRI